MHKSLCWSNIYVTQSIDWTGHKMLLLYQFFSYTWSLNRHIVTRQKKISIKVIEKSRDNFLAGKNDICRLRDIELKQVEGLQQGVLEKIFNTNTNSTPMEFP